MDIFQKSITPDKPRVLAEEQIYVYVPMATSTNAGIASYNRDQFDIIGSEVSLKWPAESFAQGPIETPSIVKVLDNEFEYTGNLIDLISGNSKISSDKLEVQLKRILRDAYERPELVMLDPNYFVRTIVEKDGKQYYKYNTTAIHYNMSQKLSEDEQAQARQNISASSISDNEATNKRIDALLQTGVYTVNGKTGNVVLKNSDLENDTNYATEQYVQENGGKIDKIVLNDNEQEIINKIVTLTIDKTTVGLSNVDNTSDLNKPISTQTQTALDGLNQTITNNFNNLNSSIENETERATLAETEISTKLQQEMNTRVQEHAEIQGKIDTINSKIPNQASSTNQLADKAFVNSTINSSAAFFKGSFKSKAALDAVEWQTTDSSLTTYVTNNDYAYVEADETHNNEAWRYIYVKDNTVSEWQPQFRVNESPFTQAQLDAINSGATADLINSINSKLTQDAIVDNTGDSSIKAISQRAATLGINAVQNNLNTHISNTQNPHNVTKTQVGLSNVDNTSDIDKPISTAVQSALDLMLPRSEAPTKVSDLENDAAYIKNNDVHGTVQIPYIYNVQRIYSVEDKDQLFGNPDGKTEIDLSSDSVSIDRQYPNTPTYIPVFASRRDDVRDVTSIQSASTKRIIVNGVEEPSFPNNMGVLRVVSEDDGSYIEANLSKLTVVQDEAGSNTLHQDSKSLIFNWNGLYLNDNEISPNTIRYDIEQTLTDEQKARARANIDASSISDNDALNAAISTKANKTDLSAVTDATLSSDSKTLTITKRDGSSFNFQGGGDTDLSGYVPITRTINAKALSSNISLSNKDVGALPDYTISISHQSAGNPRMVKFVSVNYASAATCFKMGAMTCHYNGVSYQFLTDMLIAVTTGGEVTANIYKFAQSSIGNVDGVARYTGDVFYVNDTTNKIVDFYILCGQWSVSQFTPVTKVGSTTIAYVTQYSGNANYYSSGDKVWVNGCGTTYARLSDIPTGAAADKGVVTTIDTSANLPTSNAVKTFVEGKGYVTTATYSTEAEALAASQADPNKLCFY